MLCTIFFVGGVSPVGRVQWGGVEKVLYALYIFIDNNLLLYVLYIIVALLYSYIDVVCIVSVVFEFTAAQVQPSGPMLPEP